MFPARMIGILSDRKRHPALEEFFQLFKTPWEFVRPERRYDVVLQLGDHPAGPPLNATLTVIVSGERLSLDDGSQAQPAGTFRTADLSIGMERCPVYRGLMTFRGMTDPLDVTGPDGNPAAYAVKQGQTVAVRFGFSPFDELNYLTSTGQPPRNGPVPALDLQIDLLRKVILNSGIPLTEVPPAPEGYDFVTCLTHDIDFLGLRRHGFDRTMAGFLYRATFGSVRGWLAGRRQPGQVGRNLRTALQLPLIQLGRRPDPWKPFEQYRTVEGGKPSTFFLIPFKKQPGLALNGRVETHRAVAHDVEDAAPEWNRSRQENWEAALHGIDAWHDAESGIREQSRVSRLEGSSSSHPGVRMHWLYFDSRTPSCLDDAGFGYDSTWGYNDSVGFKGGTTQVFAFPGTQRLLELPLTVQDTALLYPERMGLTEPEAAAVLDRLVATHRRFGGALTVNWHDRSLAPERLWDDAYRCLLHRLKEERTWFAQGREAVEWFRWRRSIEFETAGNGENRVRVPQTYLGKPAVLRNWKPAGQVPRPPLKLTGKNSAVYEDRTLSPTVSAEVD